MKNLNIKCLVAVLAIAFALTSCEKNEGVDLDTQPITGQTLNTILKNAVSAARQANSSTSSDNTNSTDPDYGDDIFDGFACFDFVYPIDIRRTDGVTDTVTDDDELFDFLEDQEVDYEPDFVFPITIDYGDGDTDVLITSDDLDTAFDECDDDFECFDIVFPITVTDDSGNDVVIDNEEELYTFFDAQNDAYDPIIIYPVDVIVDGDIITLNSDDEVEALYEDCDDDWDDVMCFDFVYPFDFITDGVVTTITDEDDLFNYVDTLTDEQDIDFVYPLDVIDEETDQVITITDANEFDYLIDDCGDDWNDDYCDDED